MSETAKARDGDNWTEAEWEQHSQAQATKQKSDKAMIQYVLDSALRNALTQRVTKLYKQQLTQDPKSLVKSKKMLDLLAQLTTLEEEMEDKKVTGTISFITINPRPITSVEDLKKFHALFEKALTKKWIDGYIYCYDQRADLDCWNNQLEKDGDLDDWIPKIGIHIHMVVKTFTKKKTSEMVRELYSTLKAYLGNPKHVDVQRCKPEKEIGAIDYVLLKKKDDKKSVVEGTKRFHLTHCGFDFIKEHNWDTEETDIPITQEEIL